MVCAALILGKIVPIYFRFINKSAVFSVSNFFCFLRCNLYKIRIPCAYEIFDKHISKSLVIPSHFFRHDIITSAKSIFFNIHFIRLPSDMQSDFFLFHTVIPSYPAAKTICSCPSPTVTRETLSAAICFFCAIVYVSHSSGIAANSFSNFASAAGI